MQPVRDEEAEAQRKARSRRERQARRSTQGVTLGECINAMFFYIDYKLFLLLFTYDKTIYCLLQEGLHRE